SQNLHPNNSPDLFKSDTGDDRLPQNPVGGGVGKYDKVELVGSNIHCSKKLGNFSFKTFWDRNQHLIWGNLFFPRP
ncbi:hypothetical protein, partial [Thiolapillus sp.]|uniref:hypothetical protein n=1 Tax=Thiolapillus sp. TaxID=2017437 RepID=UPI003AF83864